MFLASGVARRDAGRNARASRSIHAFSKKQARLLVVRLRQMVPMCRKMPDHNSIMILIVDRFSIHLHSGATTACVSRYS